MIIRDQHWQSANARVAILMLAVGLGGRTYESAIEDTHWLAGR